MSCTESKAVKEFNQAFNLVMYLIHTVLYPAVVCAIVFILFASQIVPGGVFVAAFWLGVAFIILRILWLFVIAANEEKIAKERKLSAAERKQKEAEHLAELKARAAQAEKDWDVALANYMGGFDEDGNDIPMDQIMSKKEYDAIEKAWDDASKAVRDYERELRTNRK